MYFVYCTNKYVEITINSDALTIVYRCDVLRKSQRRKDIVQKKRRGGGIGEVKAARVRRSRKREKEDEDEEKENEGEEEEEEEEQGVGNEEEEVGTNNTVWSMPARESATAPANKRNNRRRRRRKKATMKKMRKRNLGVVVDSFLNAEQT